MLELNFHDETEKSKTFETQRNGGRRGSRERKLKVDGGDVNLLAELGQCCCKMRALEKQNRRKTK
jgi:hypothetical protein